ncbi:MAG: TetR/AcrR family transcriptional regulator [Leptospiraceae bacterium]|nr:TetR/AcrR family transcriptional regulator [Leptospiraceae bacterium]
MKQRSNKSIQTRSRIYESAIALFQSKGFNESTMREIAKEAKISLGLTYYHFKSKEEIVLEFYKNTQTESLMQCKEYFAKEKSLKPRLQFLLEQKLNQFEPYANFLHILASSAGDPSNPLSPFSEETKEIRESAIQIFSLAIEDIGEKIPDDLKTSLPEILWFYQMGIIYYWLTDRSEKKSKSYKLVDASLELLMQLLRISKLPFMKGVRKKIIDIYNSITQK